MYLITASSPLLHTKGQQHLSYVKTIRSRLKRSKSATHAAFSDPPPPHTRARTLSTKLATNAVPFDPLLLFHRELSFP